MSKSSGQRASRSKSEFVAEFIASGLVTVMVVVSTLRLLGILS